MTWSTCDLSDEQGDLARVVTPPLLHFGGRRRFAGPVTTVRCVEDNSRLRERVETDGAGRVLVVDGGGSMSCALLGDMLAGKALENGWAGVVLNACVRDTAVLVTLDLGVMALGTSPRRSKKAGVGEVDVPIEIGGARISPGDRLFADEDGIVVLDADS